MAKYLSISIPEACTENWDSMTPTEKGRYCKSCSKTVIDFTGMTDTQVASYLKKDKGELCGRFYDDQLNRPIPIPRKEVPFLKYFFAVTLPAFLFTSKANAQQKTKEQTVLMSGSFDDLTAANMHRLIKGVVKDNNGNTLEHASIVQAGTHNGVAADTAGKFSIQVTGKNPVLKVSYAGFAEMTINITNDDNYEINLQPQDLETVVLTSYGLTTTSRRMGSVGFTHTSVNKLKSSSDSSSVKNVKKESTFNLYPSPINANNFLHFSVNADASNKQNVEIFSANGQLVQREIIVPSEQTGKILIGRLPKGYYIIKVTDPKKYTIHSKEFYVL